MVQKISKERLERSLAKGENLSQLTNTTKNWLRQNIVKDNDVKATNKTEKAVDKLINTKSKGVVNWVKNNPVEAGLLLIPGAVGVRLATKAGSFILKKYGPKAAKKVKEVIKDKGKTKDLLQLEYKKKSTPTGNINKATPPSVIRQGSSTTATTSQKEAQAKIMKKINESKTFKNLNADDKKKVVNEFAKVGKGKPITNVISEVMKKNKTDKPKLDTTNKKTFERMKEIIEERKKPEYKAKITKIRKEQKETFARNQQRKKDRIAAKRRETIKNKKEAEERRKARTESKIVKTEIKPKPVKTNKLLLDKDTFNLYKKNPSAFAINLNRNPGNMSKEKVRKLQDDLQSMLKLSKKMPKLSFEGVKRNALGEGLKKAKRGGLIKKNIGGTVLKNIPAGNKGLRKLPTPVRNKMGFAKRGGVVKKNTGGFLGAGKALRGQGAVMRKRGGKIGY